MFARLFVVLFLSISAATALTITQPSSTRWWVANSINTLAWDCSDKTYEQWTVLITNTNKNLLVSPLAVIAQQYNYDCSKSFTPTLTPGTGYQIVFGNILNSTQVYATSEPFEVKPVGSTYPDPLPPPGAASSSSGSGASPTTPPKGGAASMLHPEWMVGMVSAAVAIIGAAFGF